MIKKLIEGMELQQTIPICKCDGTGPIIRLQHGLLLNESNFLQYPTAIIGEVGSGKSYLLNQIQKPIFDHAAESGDNIVIFAAKPDILRYARPDDIVISVAGTEPSGCWNLFDELASSEDPYLTSREIAAAIFEDAKNHTMQKFFPSAAEDIFRNALDHMFDFGKRNQIHFSNADLIEFLERTPISGDDDNMGWLQFAEIYPERFAHLKDYLGNGSDQGLGVLSELRTLINQMMFGCFATADGTFSAIQTMRSANGRRIFIYYDYAGSSHSALTLFKIILDLFLKYSLDNENTKKTYFFFDEFSLLPKLNHLTDALSFGRDPSGTGKNGGCRVLIALQSVRLLTHHYSEKDAQTLLSLFPNLICLRVADSMSRVALSDRFGEARYQYAYTGYGEQIYHIDCVSDKAINDAAFASINECGQCIMHLPGVSKYPFFYDGYRKENVDYVQKI